MMEISLEYWNALAQHTILVSSLLCGFSISVLANLLVYESDNHWVSRTLKAATLAAACFLVSVFAWGNIFLKTSPGYYSDVIQKDFFTVRLIGGLSLLLGVLFLCVFIALSGWIKSRNTGIFTTAIGLLAFILIAMMSG